MPPGVNWTGLAIKGGIAVVLIVVFGPVALGAIVTLAILSLLLRLVSPSSLRGGGPGFFKSVFTQVTAFFLTSRLLAPARQIPVRNARLRDQSGTEHLVRVEGYITGGTLAVGDDVVLQGVYRRGTFVMKRGWNNRIRAELRVRPR
jgi:hypothetical protein